VTIYHFNPVQRFPLTSADFSSAGHIKLLPANNSPAAIKLRKAAAEFESMLISNLWKSMKSSLGESSEDDSTDPSHDILDDWGIRAMSSAVANAGGLGIGKLILKDLEPKLALSQNGNSITTHKDSPSSADIPFEER
jgi:Rod binding domain-containing protein